jgi:hypothetical protein
MYLVKHGAHRPAELIRVQQKRTTGLREQRAAVAAAAAEAAAFHARREREQAEERGARAAAAEVRSPRAVAVAGTPLRDPRSPGGSCSGHCGGGTQQLSSGAWVPPPRLTLPAREGQPFSSPAGLTGPAGLTTPISGEWPGRDSRADYLLDLYNSPT